MQDAFSGVVDLERDAHASLYRQIYDQLRSAILTGKLPAGTRVPPSRVMAVQLGVARNTVLAAVEQLAAEGFLETRQGAGTIVSARLSTELTWAAKRQQAPAARKHRLARPGEQLAGVTRSARGGEAPGPLLPGIPDLRAFPEDIWGRLLRRAAQRLEPDFSAYGWTAGLPRLREALAGHLREARGVRAAPEQIVVTSSAQAALDLLARALIDPGDTVWIEEPGYLGARAAFAGAGANLLPVPLDAHGLNPDAGHDAPRLIYVTPSHQYPTGRLMPLGRRLELLERAGHHDAYILEDDYDSEFQFQGRPVAALQGLDSRGSVLYVGTFSKILQPGIRAGYAVVPEGLVEPLERMQRNTGQVLAAVVQQALAYFIEEGHLRAHIRRMCTLYRERQEALVALLEARFAGVLSVEKPAGGMQLIAGLAGGENDVALSEAFARAGVATRPVSQFYIGEPQQQGCLLGFAGYGVEAMTRAADAMVRGVDWDRLQ